ncbi:integrase [Streptomyces decoyicus]|uniref:integrase n=1 Tax=Streptomyces decoyicus TaxID=249567 RepID=UPI002E19B7AD
MANTTQPVTTSGPAADLPGQCDPATEARLKQLDRDATQRVEDSRPEKARSGYGADWRACQRFCAEAGLPPLAVRSGTLVLFVAWCWIQPGRRAGTLMAPATIDRRLSGVVVTARRQHRLALPVEVAEEARALLKEKVTVMEKAGEQRGRGPAEALLVRHMEAIAATVPRDRTGIRGLALMTLHFAVAGREHELAALRLRDISDDAEGRGLVVDIRVSKIAPRIVQVPYGSRAHLCPVRTWHRWREAADLTDPDGHAFRRLHNRWATVMDAGLSPRPSATS